MPRYRVLEKSFLNHTIFEEGAEIDFDGLPGSNLEPLDDDARAKVIEFKASDEARRKKLLDEFPAAGMGDPEAFAKAIRAELANAQVAQADVIAQAIAAALASAFPNGMHKPAVVAPDAPPLT